MILYAWSWGYGHKIFTGSEARSENYGDPMCPGICSPGIEPDCNTLCIELGFAGGYCKGYTCFCKPKSSKPSNILLP